MIVRQTHTHIKVKCANRQNSVDELEPVLYLMQVYDANTHLFLGTATSDIPQITFSSLPKNHDGLELFIRTMSAKSLTSDAAIVFAPPSAKVEPHIGGKTLKFCFGGGFKGKVREAIHKFINKTAVINFAFILNLFLMFCIVHVSNI